MSFIDKITDPVKKAAAKAAEATLKGLGLKVRDKEGKVHSRRKSMLDLASRMADQVNAYNLYADQDHYPAIFNANRHLLHIVDRVSLHVLTLSSVRCPTVEPAPPQRKPQGDGLTALYDGIQIARKRQDDLDTEIKALDKAIESQNVQEVKIFGYISEIVAGLNREAQRFVAFMETLKEINGQKPGFPVPRPPIDGDFATIRSAQTAALHQYEIVHQLNTGWTNARTKNPKITKKSFIDNFIIVNGEVAPRATLDALLEAIITHSDPL